MGITRWIAAGVVLSVVISGNDGLRKRCLACHTANQIPDTIIYRRYLQTYSSKTRMADAIERYLRHPDRNLSIMPRQFFFKFPMKPEGAYEADTLRQDIEAYLRHFDMTKRLRLKPEGS